MKHIVVIAGNKKQFDEYVNYQLLTYSFTSDDNSLVLEGKTFLYVNDAHQLQGYLLSSNAELVKVGTWYKLPGNDIFDIEEQFKSRKMVIKA